MSNNWKIRGMKLVGGTMLALSLCFVPTIMVEAEDDSTFTVDGVTYTIYGEENDGVKVTALANDSQYTEITIPAEVTYAEDDDKKTYTVTKIDRLNEGMGVSDNTYLTTLTIEANADIPDQMLENFTNLTTLNISGTGEIGYAVLGQSVSSKNTSLTTLSITGNRTITEDSSHVGAFAYCSKLEEVTLENVTIKGDAAFGSCVELSNLTMTNVTITGTDTFSGCKKLEDVSIPSGMTTIPEATFKECQFTSITIPSSVTSIGQYAFANNDNLTTITIEGSNVELNESIFDVSTNLETVYVTNEAMKSTVEAHFENAWKKKESVDENEKQGFEYYPTDVTVINLNPDKIVSEPTVYISPAWEPTTPEEIFAFGLKGSDSPSYSVVEGEEPIAVYNEVQGPLCINVMKVAAGQATLGRTYSILVNDAYVYGTDGTYTITLSIPEELRQEGRTFQMICVTENGAYNVLEDLDTNNDTITFATKNFHAFGLCYQD